MGHKGARRSDSQHVVHHPPHFLPTHHHRRQIRLFTQVSVSLVLIHFLGHLFFVAAIGMQAGVWLLISTGGTYVFSQERGPLY